MENRTVNVIVTTPEGEVLDRITLEIPEGCKHVAVKAVNYSIGHNQFEEILTIGLRNP